LRRPWAIGHSEPMSCRRSALVAAVLTAALALGMAPAAASAKPATTATSGPTWTKYFFPLKVGWTCQETLTTGTTGTETLTVTAVTKTKAGQQVTVDEGSSTRVNGTNVPSNAANHYVITKSGELISAPSAGLMAGQAYRDVGNTVYPSVHTPLAGGSGLSRAHVSAPLAQSDLAQVKSVLTPHATSLEMNIVLEQSGTKVALLHTSAGTYHDVLAVRSTLHSLDITDAQESARRELDRDIEPTLAKTVANTVWYAPGAGPVKVVSGGITGLVTSCSAGAGASTTPST
jgi:hypothetical protein